VAYDSEVCGLEVYGLQVCGSEVYGLEVCGSEVYGSCFSAFSVVE
jgi:hypothetical protein